MHVLVTGSSGLVGKSLLETLRKDAHSVTVLLRPQTKIPVDFKFGRIPWDPDQDRIDSGSLHRIDAVVNLAGENIAGGRWTASRKRAIRESRVRGTRLLSETIAKMTPPPKVLVSASAIGYYGDRGQELLTEDSAPGSDFLSRVCQDWEAATAPAAQAGIRVVHLRTGLVLSSRGGALSKMLLPFKLGLGGRVGPGSQFMSWITLEDEVRAILFALQDESLAGPVNAVAPQPVINAEFTRRLGKALSRPTIFPMPAFAARLAFGEMADALLLSSTRVHPARLESAGFAFKHTELDDGLRAAL